MSLFELVDSVVKDYISKGAHSNFANTARKLNATISGNRAHGEFDGYQFSLEHLNWSHDGCYRLELPNMPCWLEDGRLIGPLPLLTLIALEATSSLTKRFAHHAQHNTTFERGALVHRGQFRSPVSRMRSLVQTAQLLETELAKVGVRHEPSEDAGLATRRRKRLEHLLRRDPQERPELVCDLLAGLRAGEDDQAIADLVRDAARQARPGTIRQVLGALLDGEPPTSAGKLTSLMAQSLGYAPYVEAWLKLVTDVDVLHAVVRTATLPKALRMAAVARIGELGTRSDVERLLELAKAERGIAVKNAELRAAVRSIQARLDHVETGGLSVTEGSGTGKLSHC